VSLKSESGWSVTTFTNSRPTDLPHLIPKLWQVRSSGMSASAPGPVATTSPPPATAAPSSAAASFCPAGPRPFRVNMPHPSDSRTPL